MTSIGCFCSEQKGPKKSDVVRRVNMSWWVSDPEKGCEMSHDILSYLQLLPTASTFDRLHPWQTVSLKGSTAHSSHLHREHPVQDGTSVKWQLAPSSFVTKNVTWDVAFRFHAEHTGFACQSKHNVVCTSLCCVLCLQGILLKVSVRKTKGQLPCSIASCSAQEHRKWTLIAKCQWTLFKIALTQNHFVELTNLCSARDGTTTWKQTAGEKSAPSLQNVQLFVCPTAPFTGGLFQCQQNSVWFVFSLATRAKVLGVFTFHNLAWCLKGFLQRSTIRTSVLCPLFHWQPLEVLSWFWIAE